MEYIDKSVNEAEGCQVTRDYLENVCWLAEEGRYGNIDYDGSFKTIGYKKRLTEILLENQKHYCCYCMRRLPDNSACITLEHIVPQSADAETGHEPYLQLGIQEISLQNIIPEKVFKKLTSPIMPPYPHSVAYHNLVVSCDGSFPEVKGSKQCCNHARGNHFVYPFYLCADVQNMIGYWVNGEVILNQETASEQVKASWFNSVSALKLNCENLKVIRRLWYLLQNNDYGMLQKALYDRNRRIRVLLEVLYKEEAFLDMDNKIYAKFQIKEYWETFLSYSWFYIYFRSTKLR